MTPRHRSNLSPLTVTLPCLLVLLGLTWQAGRAAESPAPATAPAGKLVIVSAVYGDLGGGKTADVTAKVAAMARDNGLSLDVNTTTLGDAAPGAAKKLKVNYTVDGIYRSRTVDEGDHLDISTRLFILKAVYGDLPSGDSADVTEQVSDMVRKNSLSVEASNDNFGDPASGTPKKLRVDYSFDGAKKSKTVNEGQTLTISDKGA